MISSISPRILPVATPVRFGEQEPEPVELRLYREKKLSPWPLRVGGLLGMLALWSGIGVGAYQSFESIQWRRPDGVLVSKPEPGAKRDLVSLDPTPFSRGMGLGVGGMAIAAMVGIGVHMKNLKKALDDEKKPPSA